MGSEQQFCLRWNNFQHSLLTSLPQLLDADDLTDVTLCAGGKSVKAHRVVLSACSHYFKELFREMQPFYHPVIVLPQTSYSDVCALVSFMYSGEVNIYQEQLPSLLAAAAALHIRGLAEVPHSTAVTARNNNEGAKSPPNKRPKITSTPVTPPITPAVSAIPTSSTPISSEPQNLATSLKPLDLGDSSPRFDNHKNHDDDMRTDSAESSALDCSDPLPLTLHAETTPFADDTFARGHSTSDDSHGSELDIPDKLPSAMNHPLNFLPSSSIFSPLTSLARNKLFATCHICGKSLSNQYNLRVHLETHQNLNYSCSLCAHVSRSRDALRKHIAYKHTATPRKSNSASGSPEEKVTDLKFNNNSQQASC